MQHLQVEFYGIPRERAGVAEAEVAVAQHGSTLKAVFQSLQKQFPSLARDCFFADQLQPHFIACVDGERFVRDPDAVVKPGQALMILSADAGG